jgi:hypothetical protein
MLKRSQWKISKQMIYKASLKTGNLYFELCKFSSYFKKCMEKPYMALLYSYEPT